MKMANCGPLYARSDRSAFLQARVRFSLLHYVWDYVLSLSRPDT